MTGEDGANAIRTNRSANRREPGAQNTQVRDVAKGSEGIGLFIWIVGPVVGVSGVYLVFRGLGLLGAFHFEPVLAEYTRTPPLVLMGILAGVAMVVGTRLLQPRQGRTWRWWVGTAGTISFASFAGPWLIVLVMWSFWAGFMVLLRSNSPGSAAFVVAAAFSVSMLFLSVLRGWIPLRGPIPAVMHVAIGVSVLAMALVALPPTEEVGGFFYIGGRMAAWAAAFPAIFFGLLGIRPVVCSPEDRGVMAYLGYAGRAFVIAASLSVNLFMAEHFTVYFVG